MADSRAGSRRWGAFLNSGCFPCDGPREPQDPKSPKKNEVAQKWVYCRKTLLSDLLFDLFLVFSRNLLLGYFIFSVILGLVAHAGRHKVFAGKDKESSERSVNCALQSAIFNRPFLAVFAWTGSTWCLDAWEGGDPYLEDRNLLKQGG